MPLLFCVAFLFDPKNGKKRFEMTLFLSLTIVEVPSMVCNIRVGSVGGAVFNFFRFGGCLLCCSLA